MFRRISLFALVSAVFALGACEARPGDEVRADARPQPAVEVALGEPEIVEVTETVSPPRAETILEREALPRRPGDTADYAALGDEHMAAGRAMEAVGAYRVALSVDDGADTWRKLGEAYLAADDTERGVSCLEEAVALDTGLADARKALVKHHLAQSDGARARLHAEELVRQRPLDPAARQMLGRAFMQEKMWREAIGSFQLVVNDEPDNIYAHNNIGFSALQIGELELAREHLERTLSLEPQQGYMLNNLGVTYERLGRSAEAHAAFTRAAELSPRYAQALLNRDRLQGGLTQDERIVSAETLVHLRAPPAAPGADVVREAMDAAASVPSGSARLAPAADFVE